MRYLIHHETLWVYPHPVREHHCELRAAPREDQHQRLLSFAMESEPPSEFAHYLDCFGNRVHHFSVLSAHERLATRMRAEVECSLLNPFAFEPVAPGREREWIAEALRAQPRLMDYLVHRSALTPALGEVLDDATGVPQARAGQPLLEAVQQASEWVGEHLEYATESAQDCSSLAAVWEKKAGLCQDFAHLLLSLVRSWGIPARYVTGYLDPGALEVPRCRPLGTHAWVEVLIPGAGWLGFDPTHGLLANASYIAVAVGRDCLDATPRRDTFKGGPPGEPPAVRVEMVAQQ